MRDERQLLGRRTDGDACEWMFEEKATITDEDGRTDRPSIRRVSEVGADSGRVGRAGSERLASYPLSLVPLMVTDRPAMRV